MSAADRSGGCTARIISRRKTSSPSRLLPTSWSDSGVPKLKSPRVFGSAGKPWSVPPPLLLTTLLATSAARSRSNSE